jgi:uncharacterized protein (DUF1330 family)
MKGYWIILGGEIVDQEAQAEYGRLWAPIAEKYRARLNPTAVPPLLKDTRNTRRVVIVEFPSYRMARDCFDDPAYQAARDMALKASERDLLIVEGELT